jgi:hypothetical protein
LSYSMANLFATAGDDLDLGYLNLRAGRHRRERDIARVLEQMWARYEPYADRDFVPGFARDPEARFWEMYLGCALLDTGKTLLPTAERPRDGGHPDLCVVDANRRIWIEAIAPDRGRPGEDQIPEIVPLNQGGRVEAQPVRQIQLRITSALWEKTKILKRYLKTGVIDATDLCLIAIGAGRFGIYAQGLGFPLALSAVFPIGSEFVCVDRDTLEIVRRGFRSSGEIERTGADNVPRTAFLDPTFSHVSGLLWSRASIGNMSRAMRPLSFIHNPLCRDYKRLPQKWGAWDREFVAAQTGHEWTATDILAEL